ncbi:hypothetical protein [Celeribacter litoreus]|uniref:hypothetical protein n=1 Tax=Celeribacter litoreus TaxID=2876714 RepID=UPI001CCB40A3|nr:hypothetical protein [Celeribacter litoreus]MCA0044223.1 hypothetical protein [Celeribacter litoreus]
MYKDRPFLFALLALLVFWSLLAILAPSSVYTVDEMVLYAGFSAMDQDGSLFIENGYKEFGSEALQNWFMTGGPSGLSQQYPSGYTYLGYPFWALAGIRGLFILNAIAAVGVVALTYALASVFAERAIARWAAGLLVFGSFLTDYAGGIWPHSLAVFFTMVAIYAAVRAEGAGQIICDLGAGRGARLWYRVKHPR